MKPNERAYLASLIRQEFKSLDDIELSGKGRMLINMAEEFGLIDLHTELCESYNQRTKTNGAEDASVRGVLHVLRYLDNAFGKSVA